MARDTNRYIRRKNRQCSGLVCRKVSRTLDSWWKNRRSSLARLYDRSWQIVLKKSANRPFATMPRDRRAWALLCLGGLQRRARDQLCELPEILGGGRQKELVSSTQWASQPETVEAQDTLEVRKEHFDLLPLTPRCHVGIGLGDFARDVSSLFVD
jgi:hypothetical protein